MSGLKVIKEAQRGNLQVTQGSDEQGRILSMCRAKFLQLKPQDFKQVLKQPHLAASVLEIVYGFNLLE
jgi:hypothetical protein